MLTKTPEAVSNVNVAPFSLLRSDHFAVTFHLSYVPVTSPQKLNHSLIILKLMGMDYHSHHCTIVPSQVQL